MRGKLRARLAVSAFAIAVLAAALAGVNASAGPTGSGSAGQSDVEPAVPPPGNAMTASQAQEIRETALRVASDYGDYAPTKVDIAGATKTLAQALGMFEPGSTPPTITDPRTGKPMSESSVFVVT